MPAEVSSEAEAPSDAGNICRTAFRCKKCRRAVALQENVLDHIPGEGETSFDWHKRKGGNPFNKSGESECSSVFVEPLQWMTPGKLICQFVILTLSTLFLGLCKC